MLNYYLVEVKLLFNNANKVNITNINKLLSL